MVWIRLTYKLELLSNCHTQGVQPEGWMPDRYKMVLSISISMVASEVNTDFVFLIFNIKCHTMPNKYDINTSVKQLKATLYFLFPAVYINIEWSSMLNLGSIWLEVFKDIHWVGWHLRLSKVNSNAFWAY